ncbi:D-2-hydroxyacid dehydrogenase family protein [Cupriavidus sp. 2TAF22]|uniref:D-2-hydroxyacid dehydrogenase family protein n=1 Tax=unclassified Cupriavidus TaxID=2640874 RepID=UPI003F8F58CD
MPKPIIAIIDDYERFVPGLAAYRELRAALPAADIRLISEQPLGAAGLAQLEDVEYLVLIRERTRITRELLAKLPSLKTIVQTGSTGIGVTAHVDTTACAERGIDVLEGKTDGHSAAELTWALVLAAHRRLPQYIDSLRTGRWHQGSGAAIGETLRGKTFGILGYGRIGQLLGGYAKAFGMTVLVWGRQRSLEAARADGVKVAESRACLFANSDVLTIQLRLNEETLHSVKLADLQAMKPSAIFVNTSRAALVEPGALAAALKGGTPGMAAIDVYESEPISADHSLLQLGNVLATPHIGYVERDSYEILFRSAFQKLVAHVQGDFARHCQVR